MNKGFHLDQPVVCQKSMRIYSEMKLSEGLRQREQEQNKAEIDEIPTLPDSRDLTREQNSGIIE